ncbi:fimbria/pilus periplasmic chaperone [Morganella psychrotolerans]|nr:fimbria/pilus periplasmic chaperone [Morganella psychrotolerans]
MMNINIKLIKKPLITLLALLSMSPVFSVYASEYGGVALGSTRLIYPIGEKQINLPISNSDKNKVFLIQSWVSNEDGKKTDDFIVTPPLFTLNQNSENILRIIYAGDENLPTDRETLFYLNSKAIPSVKKEDMNGNSLQIATQSVIKLFMRPAGLSFPIDKIPGALRCQIKDNSVLIENPTPYYVTLVNIKSGAESLPGTMASPFTTVTLPLPAHNNKSVSFQTVNDYGATTSSINCP